MQPAGMVKLFLVGRVVDQNAHIIVGAGGPQFALFLLLLPFAFTACPVASS
jgi:hypothetical protein